MARTVTRRGVAMRRDHQRPRGATTGARVIGSVVRILNRSYYPTHIERCKCPAENTAATLVFSVFAAGHIPVTATRKEWGSNISQLCYPNTFRHMQVDKNRLPRSIDRLLSRDHTDLYPASAALPVAVGGCARSGSQAHRPSALGAHAVQTFSPARARFLPSSTRDCPGTWMAVQSAGDTKI